MEHKGLQSDSKSFVATDGIRDSLSREAGALGSAISESVIRGKDAVGTVATETMNSAGSDLQSLRSDLNSLKDKVAKFMSKAGSDAEKSARHLTSKVAGQVSGIAGDLAGTGAEMASAATEQAKTFASDFERMVRRYPMGAMAGAVMVGGLIGLLGRRS